jgi:hypothetical protein
VESYTSLIGSEPHSSGGLRRAAFSQNGLPEDITMDLALGMRRRHVVLGSGTILFLALAGIVTCDMIFSE